MYKFKTIRCRNCNSVIYNLPESEIKKIKLIDLYCDDCKDHSSLDSSKQDVKKSKLLSVG